MRKLIVVLALVVLSCNAQKNGLAGSIHRSFGGAELVTEFRTVPEKVALVHVLFVPDVDVPNGGFGTATSAGGTVKSSNITFEYAEDSGLTIRGEVAIEDATVRGGGQSFQLADGNVFVLNASRDGRTQLSQIRVVLRDPDLSGETILSTITGASPGNARVQALVASK